MKAYIALLLPLALGRAEVKTMTLREAVAQALKQNPDLVMARLDQTKAQLGIQVARDPFLPKVYGGSGAAKTFGYPSAINGSPPSIFEARTLMSLYNRPQSYTLAQSRENARGADIDLSRQQDEIVFRTASLFLDAQQSARLAEMAARQIDSLTKMQESVRARVAEGRELEIQNKRAELNVAKARQRSESLVTDQDEAEQMLATVLGFPPEDRVRPVRDESADVESLPSEEAATEEALKSSKEMRLLESRMQAKSLEIRGYKSARMPTIDLVAQYNLLARSTFQDFFPGQFQRHNGQIGAAITVPLLVGPSARAYVSQSEADLAKLRAQAGITRNRIMTDTRKSYQDLRKAEAARTVARLDLDVTREQLSIVLAQFEEGRSSLRDLEQARIDENEKWLAYYDSQHTWEKAKLNVLKQAGSLTASLK